MKNSWKTGRAGLALLAFGAAILAVFTATPANAATTDGASSSDNCGVIIETAEVICVPAGDDLHAAVMAATGKTVVIATPKRMPQAVGVSPASVFLLGKLFDDANFGGGSLEMYGYDSGCTSNTSFGFADIGSAWYGRVSSFLGYSNCQVKIFENTNFGGASYGFYGSSSYVGDAMNDRTKSVQFHS